MRTHCRGQDLREMKPGLSESDSCNFIEYRSAAIGTLRLQSADFG